MTSSRGRKPRRLQKRTPIPIDAASDARQTRAFELSLSGFTATSIAKSLGIDRGTASLDIKLEGQRRAQERAADRVALIDRSVQRYEKLMSDATLRIAELRNDAAAAPKWNARNQIKHLIRLEAQELRKLQVESETVQGLRAPNLVDASSTTTNNYNNSEQVGNALSAFDSVNPDFRAFMRKVAVERRAVKEAELVRQIAEEDAQKK